MNQDMPFNPKNLKTIAIITIICLILSLGVSLAQKPKYQSSVRLLVIFNDSNIDPYTASRTSQYITTVLGSIIYSNSFIDNVFKTSYDVKDALGTNPDKREQNWKNMVHVKIQDTEGIIDIDVLHPDRDQSFQFAQAITYTLVTKNQFYHGYGDKVSIKILNSPITSAGWAQPKIVRNGLLGLGAGLIIGLTIVVLFPRQDMFKLSAPDHKRIAKSNRTNEELVAESYVATHYNSYTPAPGPEFIPPETETLTDNADQEDGPKNQFYNW